MNVLGPNHPNASDDGGKAPTLLGWVGHTKATTDRAKRYVRQPGNWSPYLRRNVPHRRAKVKNWRVPSSCVRYKRQYYVRYKRQHSARIEREAVLPLSIYLRNVDPLAELELGPTK